MIDPFRQGDTFDPSLVAWVTEEEHMPNLLESVIGASEAVPDLETTGLDEYATHAHGYPARIVLASLTLPQIGKDDEEPPTFVIPLSHPASPFRGRWRQIMKQIAIAILEANKPINNQNVKFDSRWVYAHTGIDLSHLIRWDTQISSHLLEENESTKLKERAPATFGIERWDDFDLTVPGAAERVPLYDLGVYAARDTYWTWRLAVAHRTLMNVGPQADPEFEPAGPEEVEDARLGTLATWCSMPTVATLTAIEQRGIKLDIDWTQNLLRQLTTKADDLQSQIVDRYSLDLPAGTPISFHATSRFFIAWTEAAVGAGDLRVASLTGTGKPQWNRAVLKRQARAGSEVAKILLDWRKADKATEFLESWLDKTGPDGRVRTTYHAGRNYETGQTGGTVTGRLSSSGPNMQQVTGPLKPAFIPSPGYLLAEFDHSQIELRIAAHVAQCIPMLEAFRRGDDLHRLLGARIAQVEIDEVTGEIRQTAKPANFGLLYGMGAAGFQEYAEVNYDVYFSIEEAEAVRSTYFEMWDGLTDWHAREITRAHNTGQVVSPIGRVRRLPDIHDGNPKRASHAERQAINSPVQSLASDVLLIGAAAVEGTLPGYSPLEGVRLVGTVHDSIVAEIRADDWKRLAAKTARRLLDIEPVLAKMGCTLTVPLAIECKIGTRWGSADVAVIS